MTDTPPLTYSCPCGAIHSAGLWAAAHWDARLRHRCPDCGRVNTIQAGRVVASKTLPPRQPRERITYEL